MPTCVECGAEAPRDEMFGLPDELRCASCARRTREKYVPHRPIENNIRPWVTVIVFAASVVATIAQWWLAPAAVEQYMVSTPDAIWSGEVWRFITSVLLHGNLLHIGFNCLWLLRFGRDLEKWLGHWRYTAYIVVLAGGSNAGQFLWSGLAIGLSGVVYGMFGTLLALRRHKDFAARQMEPQVVQTMIVWLFLCIFLLQGIANAAHVVGLGLGWLIGRAVLTRWPVPAVAGVAILSAALMAATVYMPWDGLYCLHRAQQSLMSGDLPAGGEWLRKAADAPVRPMRLPDPRDVDGEQA